MFDIQVGAKTKLILNSRIVHNRKNLSVFEYKNVLSLDTNAL